MYTHADEELKPVDDKFDYLATYHSQSDLSLSYITADYVKRNSTLPTINYARNKIKMALWSVNELIDKLHVYCSTFCYALVEFYDFHFHSTIPF